MDQPERQRRHANGDRPPPQPELLVRVATKRQLLMQSGRDEDQQELPAGESAAERVTQVGKENDQRAACGDEDSGERPAESQLPDRRERPHAQTERPAPAIGNANRGGGSGNRRQEAGPLHVGEQEDASRDEYGKIDRHEQTDRREYIRSGMRQLTTDLAALVLRVAAGLIFIPHGWSKVFGAQGVSGFAQDLPSYGVPAFLGYAAAYSELAGGALLILGLLTRIDAFLLACTMFVAAFVVQLPDALRDPENMGNRFFGAIRAIETPLALFVICVALMLLGGGRFALDALVATFRSRRRDAGT